jgi:hypothetical protein
VAVAGGERVADDLLGLLRRDLEDAEAQDRHPDTVVERDLGNLCWHHVLLLTLAAVVPG